MSYQLKIKYKELSAESAANKLECRKMLQKARVVTTQQLETAQKRLQTARNHLAFLRSDPHTPKHILDGQTVTCIRMSNKVDYLKSKLKKSVPSENTINKLKIDAYDCRKHRLEVVVPEARATHIAYGYLKGRSYEQIEGATKTKHLVNWNRVATMVYKYGSVRARQEFPAWLSSIGFYVEKIPAPGKLSVYNYKVVKKAA